MQPGTAPHPTLPTQLAVSSTKPVVLYRDTNAWCPFCERIWLALLHKGIPFDVIFIDLRNKPDWFAFPSLCFKNTSTISPLPICTVKFYARWFSASPGGFRAALLCSRCRQ